jgi:hypothetical protein
MVVTGGARADLSRYRREAGHDFSSSQVKPDPRPLGEGAGMGQESEQDIDRSALLPAGVGDDDTPTCDSGTVDPGDGERRAASGLRTVPLLTVYLDAPDPTALLSRQRADLIAHIHRTAPGSPGDDRAGSRDAEHTIDGEPKEIVARAVGCAVCGGCQGGREHVDSLPCHRRCDQGRFPCDPRAGEPVAEIRHHEVQPVPLDEIRLGDHGQPRADTEKLQDGQVLHGLRHDAFVGRHYQECDVDARCAGHHVPHEVFMPRHVDDARGDPVGELQGSKPQVDGDAASLLFLPTIGLHTGQSANEGGLPVVDVSRRTDNDVPAHAIRSQKARALRSLVSARWLCTKRVRRRRWAAA